jgi:MFS family permease
MQSMSVKIKPYLTVLFIQNLSLALVYPAIPAAIFAISETRSEAIAYSTIDLVFFPLTYIIGTFYTGKVLDRNGRRPLLLAGMAVNALGLALLQHPQFNLQVLASRSLSGAGQAYTSVVQANISDITTPSSRPKYFGLVNSTIASSFIAGLLLSGLLNWGYKSLDVLFALSLACSVIGLVVAYLYCPETYRLGRIGNHKDENRAEEGASESEVRGLRATAKLFRGREGGGLWILLCLNFSNLGVFAFWTLYTKSRFDWSIAQTSGSLLLISAVAVISQSIVLPYCLKKWRVRALLNSAIVSNIIYLILLGACTNGLLFAMLPVFNVVGFTATSLLQGKLSEQTAPERQGLLTSTFGLLTGSGTLITVVLSGMLTWVMSGPASHSNWSQGLPFFVLAMLLGLCWITVGKDIALSRD